MRFKRLRGPPPTINADRDCFVLLQPLDRDTHTTHGFAAIRQNVCGITTHVPLFTPREPLHALKTKDLLMA